MAVQTIDAALFCRMFLTGAHYLDAKKDWINELNVFPVPDGDTGTNMTLTIMSAVREVQNLDEISMKTLSKAISSGSLRGARGNSGVILSQLFRGFTKVIKGEDEITIPMIADACEKACETAYKAVIKPKEGTILTVAKGMAEIARSLVDGQMELEDYVKNIIDYGNQVLAKTPDMLPVLKEAGVVDSGGQGLMTVLEGAYDALMGKEVDLSFDSEGKKEAAEKKEEEELKFAYYMAYDVELQKSLSQAKVDEFRAFLMNAGGSVSLMTENTRMSVKMLASEPGIILTKAQTYGELYNVDVANIKIEHKEKLMKKAVEEAKKQDQQIAKAAEPSKPPKKAGFVAVAAGEGFAEIFKGLGADYVISGGQTMNPSTEDVINAIDQVNAENVFLYPNNKNIIMAANQARALVQEKNIIVIPTKTVPQGITAMLTYDPSQEIAENQDAMNEAVAGVRTAEITYAIRDTTIDDFEIHQGDIMAVGDSGMLTVGKDVDTVAVDAVEKMMDEDAELISIYFGKDYSEENANRLAQQIQEKYSGCDVEVNNGGQPVYYCVISVE
ncbi:MAG: DAK2 domain-containing protein [Eubacterium sp.]|nr:DAK2 domain-containing protein [Eubacterium sp.]